MNRWFFILSIVLISFVSCETLLPKGKVDTTYSRSIIPYDLQQPDSIFPLSHDLEEISGLASYGEDQLAAIDDEEGKVFILSKMGKIIGDIKFDLGDDYEGISLVNNDIYVVNSTGDIYKVSKEIEKFNTPLKHKNNVEGLTYDKNGNQFLIACKGDAGIGENLPGRAVYQFNLSTKKMNLEPYLNFRPSELNSFIQKRDPDLEITDFAPSAIAIHPQLNYLYILAHKGKALAVFNRQNELLEVVKLTIDHYKQPEGICFSSDGSKLFISNEGRGGRANLLVFSMKN